MGDSLKGIYGEGRQAEIRAAGDFTGTPENGSKEKRGGSHEEILLQGKRGNEGGQRTRRTPLETEGPKHMPTEVREPELGERMWVAHVAGRWRRQGKGQRCPGHELRGDRSIRQDAGHLPGEAEGGAEEEGGRG